MNKLVLCALVTLSSVTAFAGTAFRGDTRTIGRDSYSLASTGAVCAAMDMQSLGAARQSTEADAVAKARARLDKFDGECVHLGGTITEEYVQPSSRLDVNGYSRICSTPAPVFPGHVPGRPNAPAQPVFCSSVAYGCEIYSHAEVKHACN